MSPAVAIDYKHDSFSKKAPFGVCGGGSRSRPRTHRAGEEGLLQLQRSRVRDKGSDASPEKGSEPPALNAGDVARACVICFQYGCRERHDECASGVRRRGKKGIAAAYLQCGHLLMHTGTHRLLCAVAFTCAREIPPFSAVVNYADFVRFGLK